MNEVRACGWATYQCSGDPISNLTGNVMSCLEQSAARVPNGAAIITDDETITYRELAHRTRAAANWLRARGVGAGDRVALLLPNSLDFAVLVHGIAHLGAVAVPLGPRLGPGEIDVRLRAAGVRLRCETGGQSPCAMPGDRMRGTEGDCPHSSTVIFTSGSAGEPTAVVLTAANHRASADASARVLGVQPDDRWLACLPFSHVGGLSILWRSAIYGTAALIHERFDAARANAAIDRQRVTIVSVVATMLQRMLDERGGRPYPPWLRCVLLGGGPAPRPLLEACARRALPIALSYGMTETASQIATLAPGTAARAPDSVGQPLPGAAVRIVRDGAPVAAGEVGEIEVRGPMLSPGELRDGVFVARAGEWLRTRDLGRADADGVLYVVGRADDVIISGGENIHPREVEQVLEAHPAVAEACVFGLPDPQWGESVAAWVQPRPGWSLDGEMLTRHARHRLAGFKVPRRITVVADFPRSAAGKVLRREVRRAAQRG